MGYLKDPIEKLEGDTITLHLNTPNQDLAYTIYDKINENREYLQQWLPTINFTNSPRGALRYLIECEYHRANGEGFFYGIFKQQDYIGNIGVFNASNDNQLAEIVEYWVLQEYSGNGIVTQAIPLIENLMFNYFQLNKLQIRIDSENIPSNRVAQKSGYRLESILKDEEYNSELQQYRDINLYSKSNSQNMR